MTIHVNINGSNDAATITLNPIMAAGDLSGGSTNIRITDPDAGESHADALSYAGTWGDLFVTSDAHGVGAVRFVANAAGHAIALGQTATDTFTVVSADGSARQTLTVQIAG